MAKRITIMLGEAIDRKLRKKQAEIIKESNSTCSFSRVINEALAGKYKI